MAVHNYTTGQSIPNIGITALLDTTEPLAVLDNPSGTRGLESFHLATKGSGTTWTDVTGRGNSLTIANASMWSRNSHGYELTTQNSGTWEISSGTGSNFRVGDSDSATFMIAFKCPTSKQDFDGIMGQALNSSWGAGWGVHFETISGTQRLVVWLDQYLNASKRILFPATILPSGEDAVIIVQIDRVASPGSVILRASVITSAGRTDGTPTSAFTLNTALSNSSLKQYVGSLNPGGGPMRSGAVRAFAMWRRVLTSGEINSLKDNPYRLSQFTINDYVECINPATGNYWLGYRPTAYDPTSNYTVTYMHGTFREADTQQDVIRNCIGLSPLGAGTVPYGNYSGPTAKTVCDSSGDITWLVPMFWYGNGGVGGTSFPNVTGAVDEVASLYAYLADLIKPYANTAFAKSTICGWSAGLAVALWAIIVKDYWSNFIGCHGQWGDQEDLASSLTQMDTDFNKVANTSYSWTNPGSWTYLQASSAATQPSGTTQVSTGANFNWRTAPLRAQKRFVFLNGSYDGNATPNDLYYPKNRANMYWFKFYGYGTAKEKIWNGGTAFAFDDPPTAPDGRYANHEWARDSVGLLVRNDMNTSVLAHSSWVDPDAPATSSNIANVGNGLLGSSVGFSSSSFLKVSAEDLRNDFILNE